MTLKRLTAFVVAFELVALGVFLLFFIAGLATLSGGEATVSMTQYGERWIEYAMVCILAAVGPYALYLLDVKVGQK